MISSEFDFNPEITVRDIIAGLEVLIKTVGLIWAIKSARARNARQKGSDHGKAGSENDGRPVPIGVDDFSDGHDDNSNSD